MRHEPAGVHQRDAAILPRRRGRARGGGQLQRVLGGLDILGEVHVRDVERVAVLVEAVCRAVGGQVALKRDARHVEEVANGVLILRAREPAQPGAARAREPRLLGGEQRLTQRLHHRSRVLRRRTRGLLRRHLAGRDAVVNFNPAREVLRIGEVRLERNQVQIPLLRVLVVAFSAVLGKVGVGWPERRFGLQGESREQGKHGR